MRISMRSLLPAGALVAAVGLMLAWMNTASAGARLSASSSSQPALQAACPPATPGQFTCFSIFRTGAASHAATPNALPKGLRPADLRSAYGLSSTTAGAGRTVAVVDAFNDPNAAGDLAKYRKTFGLPTCTIANHCFRKVNETGGTTLPKANTNWATEISLDLDMVSAICPRCHILLVEAKSTGPTDLGTAVNTAVRLHAKYVSNSYGGPESKGEATKYNHFFNHPGVALTFAAGDFGYGVDYPAASRYVTAVGGTSLQKAANARGWTDSAWSGTGSGCSKYSGKPSWQTKMSGCPSNRTVVDVSADADPSTGVLVYDSYHFSGWDMFGGTSVATPIIAAVYARASTPKAKTYPSSYPYRHKSALWDVVGGSNGRCAQKYLCTGAPGYDGPTGIGSPHTAAAFKY